MKQQVRDKERPRSLDCAHFATLRSPASHSPRSKASRTVFRYPRVEQPGAPCIYEFFNFFPEVLSILERLREEGGLAPAIS